MFPTQQVNINSEIEVAKTAGNGKAFLFDFNLGDFIVKDGKLLELEDLEALKMWIEKILRTERFKFKVYETGERVEYGISLLQFVNSGYPQAFVQAEIQREITESLLKNIKINSLENFTFSRINRTLGVSFRVNTIYGSIDKEVII
ncbi:hypothetical protein CLPUN_09820 [Clostridium puniceum]|uniref:DUF2634 domain-containing protein n=1 Tax=Clostridium puniceum TaxID=29367 RepID=A0A1S8TVQ8_9CLOT|nr:DUF2634 domain-containing protein [Clostridium puniceum]OOM81798.1 hypothetical protein CLPUN_09820 [Clostridium puniceum]